MPPRCACQRTKHYHVSGATRRPRAGVVPLRLFVGRLVLLHDEYSRHHDPDFVQQVDRHRQQRLADDVGRRQEHAEHERHRLHPQLVMNERLAALTGANPDYVEEEMKRELAEIDRRRLAYKGGTPPLEIAGRTVIVVDDGIATGGTVKAALAGIRRSAPARLVLAVPVAPEETIDEMKALADEVICLAMPEPFQAVGLHYVDFTQTRDAEVIGLMDRSREWKTA